MGKQALHFGSLARVTLVIYTWQRHEEILHIPGNFMTKPGDLIDVAYSNDAYPEFVVRYKNFNHRLV